ncbi:hypothetical protein C8Q79DRAFT_936665 [Trametes meyenii]|nr:hypothetical protein C8Q79DRAFT_936665 [Trametes meyenii]
MTADARLPRVPVHAFEGFPEICFCHFQYSRSEAPVKLLSHVGGRVLACLATASN